MPAVLSKPSILSFNEASATPVESSNHHQAGIEVVIVVVVLAGVTIIYLVCRAIIAYQTRRNGKVEDDIKTCEVLAIQDVEKATDAEKHLEVKPFVFAPADMETIVDSPPSTAPSDTSSEADTVSLITAFSSPMQFEDEGDEDDGGDTLPAAVVTSGSLSTPSTPNFLNFWMKPDSAFFRAGAATGRAVTIDAKVYIMGETVPKRREFAVKEVKICEVSEVATAEACSALVEEWPAEEESERIATPTTVVEPSTFTGSISTRASIPAPTPSLTVKTRKPVSPIVRKPLASLRPNLPSLRAALSKIPQATPPEMNAIPKSTPTEVGTRTLRVPSTTAKAPRSSSFRTLIKTTTPNSSTSTMKKSATMPLSSRSLSGTSASTLKAATKTEPEAKNPSLRAATSIFSIGRSKVTTPAPKRNISPPPSLFSTRKLSFSTTSNSITKSASGKNARLAGSTPSRAMPTWR
ncbi:hypothetical protein HGRIS_007323 [Hohenbuehelia grisea]|uniref:Uncharacterized protein n=1 Tax=Hohenbuehelia grisea TaxID=104357 RepID=A0ABR3J4E9_9AGAR